MWHSSEVFLYASFCTQCVCACAKRVINRGSHIVAFPWVPCLDSLLSNTHTHTRTPQQTCKWTSVSSNVLNSSCWSLLSLSPLQSKAYIFHSLMNYTTQPHSRTYTHHICTYRYAHQAPHIQTHRHTSSAVVELINKQATFGANKHAWKQMTVGTPASCKEPTHAGCQKKWVHAQNVKIPTDLQIFTNKEAHSTPVSKIHY